MPSRQASVTIAVAKRSSVFLLFAPAERRIGGQFLRCAIDVLTLARKVLGDRTAQRGIADVVRGVGLRRQIAACKLVLALGAGLDTLQAVRDREIDGLVVAHFKVQAGMVLRGAPVASIEAVAADHMEGARDRATVPHRQHEQRGFARCRADQREGAAVEVGPAPLARSRIHVEREERVPVGFRDLASAQPHDLKARAQCFLALLAHRLALAGCERAQEIVEALVAVVGPVELLIGALQVAQHAEPLPLRRGQERRVRAR